MDSRAIYLLVLIIKYYIEEATTASVQSECGSGYFPCHQDCCLKGEQFCNDHETQMRCQSCELRISECNTTNTHRDCMLFCHKNLQATTASPEAAAELPQEALIGIIVLGVSLALVLAVCVPLTACYFCKKRRWNCPKWLRTLVSHLDRGCCKSTQGGPGVVSLTDRHVEEGAKEDSTANTPLMTSSGGGSDGNRSSDVIDDPTVLGSISQHDSDPALAASQDTVENGITAEAVREVSTSVREEPNIARESREMRAVSERDNQADTGGAHGRDAPTTSTDTAQSRNEGVTFHSPSQSSKARGGRPDYRPASGHSSDSRSSNGGSRTDRHQGQAASNSGNPAGSKLAVDEEQKHATTQNTTQSVSNTFNIFYPIGADNTDTGIVSNGFNRRAMDVNVSSPAGRGGASSGHAHSGNDLSGGPPTAPSQPQQQQRDVPRVITNPTKTASDDPKEKGELVTSAGAYAYNSQPSPP